MSYSVRYETEPSTYARLAVAIAAVDGMTAQTMRTIGVASRAAYKASVPSKRVAKAVSSRQRKVGNTRIVRTGIGERAMGEPVHGRDVGAQAVGWWLDRGTADAGAGKIFRTTLGADGKPAPFMHWGNAVPFVRGQAAQNWLRIGRHGADVVAFALVDDLGVRIDNRFRTA